MMPRLFTRFVLWASGLDANTGLPRTRHDHSVSASSAQNGLGQLPMLSLLGAVGLLTVAFAFGRSRAGLEGAGLLFWSGIACIYLPVFARVTASDTSRREIILSVVKVGMMLYLMKVMHSPIRFTFFDEFSHWSAVDNIFESNGLFGDNVLLPIAAYFPGLHIITAVNMSISGADIFPVGVIVIGVARILWILSLFLVYEAIGGTPRGAGIAVLIYMANPSFLFFHGQFAYESLSLPLIALLLVALTRSQNYSGVPRAGLNLVMVLCICAVVITHHLSSYALICLLILWFLVSRVLAGARAMRLQSGVVLLTIIISVTWLIYIATITIGYVLPHFESGFDELAGVFIGSEEPRELFVSSAGYSAPTFERLVSYASVILISLGLVCSCTWVLLRRRSNTLAVVLALCAASYPAAMALRLTSSGAEISVRTSGFLFFAIALVLALFIDCLWLGSAKSRVGEHVRRTLLIACAGIVFAGGVVLGFAPWARMPGPYKVAADTRSIEAQGVAAGVWMDQVLEPDNRIAADRSNRLIAATYGRQLPVTNYRDRVDVASIYYAEVLDNSVKETIRKGEIDYLLVDLRMSRWAPQLGHYIESGEKRFMDDEGMRMPTPERLLRKFDEEPLMDRVMDSGDIVIYDLSPILDGRSRP